VVTEGNFISKFEPFSVSMCVYGKDSSEYFDIALNSVIEQTLKPDEIVLTVDGPIPKDTQDVINKYENILGKTEIRFKVVYIKENRGHGEARRVCFDNCSNDLIALMDADDISNAYRFEKQVSRFLENVNLSILGGQISEFIDSPQNIIGKRIVPMQDGLIKEYMKKRCPMNQMTVMFRKQAVKAVGGYLDWYCDEDYYLWIRLALKGYIFENLPECLVNVRVGEEMYNRRGGIKYFRSEAKLQRYMLKKGIISFFRYIVNVSERLLLQILMPNKIRGFIFQKFARS